MTDVADFIGMEENGEDLVDFEEDKPDEPPAQPPQQQGADADATNTEAAAEEQNATKGSATEKETSGKASADTEPNAPEENRPVVFVFPPHAPAPEATLGTAEDSALSLPPHSAEVFLGGIPRSLTKEELEELVAPFGEVAEVRLQLDAATGQNRGYGFVAFRTREHAAAAIKELNGAELKGKKGVRATLSESKFRLFIGNLPRMVQKEELHAALKFVEPGLETLDLPVETGWGAGAGRSRGFAFAQFFNEASATRCLKRLSGASLHTRALSVRWAEPKAEAPPPDLSKVRAVFVRRAGGNGGGGGEALSEATLRAVFEGHGEVERVVVPARPSAREPFAFVHFKERDVALAVAKLEKLEHEEATFEVSLARPESSGRPADARAAGGARDGGGGGGGMRGNGGMGERRGGGGDAGPRADGWGGRGYGGGYVGGFMRGGGGGGMMAAPPPGGAPLPPGAMTAGAMMGTGMKMLPMMLPNGQMAYVLAPPGAGPSHGGGGGGGGVGGGRGSYHGGDRRGGYRGDNRGHRYHPY